MKGIGISGKCGAGKTALADHLVTALVRRGVSAQRLSFADPLKQMVLQEYGLTKEDPGGREKLIEVGNAKREESPDFWVAALRHRIYSCWAANIIPVVDDMRFENELAGLGEMGFFTVRLDAPRSVRAARLSLKGLDSSHAWLVTPSEVALDHSPFDFRFHNVGISLPQLATLVLSRLDASKAA